MTNDETYMRRALELARLAEGQTSPNPMVGAVLVKDGEIVGEGFHRKAGLPHAEVEALRMAGELAQGATAYVTLEPCAHHGKTPPCADALIDAGVSRVVYAAADPNPQVNGQGAERMRNAGIQVENSLLNAEAVQLNRPFFKFIRTGLPYVTAKFAMTLDGKIATAAGDSQWITNSASRQIGHQLRNKSDAILVGVGTVLADDPRLTTRLEGEVNHPTRIVVDSKGRTPLEAKVFDTTVAPTILAVVEGVNEGYLSAVRTKNVTIWQLPADENNQVDLNALLKKMGEHNLMTLMVEGGGTLLGNLLTLGHIDHVWAFIAPKIVGGKDAPTPFSGAGIGKLGDALQLTNIEVNSLDGDIFIKGDVS